MNPRRARLAARLREVRASGFSSGLALARAAHWQQSRVSRIETGAQLPTEADINTWVTLTDAGVTVEVELLDLLSDARIEYVSARDMQRGRGLADWQASLRGLEAAAHVISNYEPTVVPGLVQTEAYSRELLALPGGPLASGAPPADIEAIIGERIRRQAILYQPDKQIRLVIGETALRSAPLTRETLRGQLDRLTTITALRTLTIGIIPLANPMPVVPIPAFVMHDSYVLVETLTGEQRFEQPDEVAVYADVFALLIDAAVVRDGAAELIRGAMRDL